MAKKKRFKKKKRDKRPNGQMVKLLEKKPELTLQKNLALIAISLFIIHSLLTTFKLFLADVSFNNGEQMKRYGLYEAAVEYYRKAISLNYNEPRYHRELAASLAELEMTGEAEREAEIAYNLNPKNSLTVRSLISTYTSLSEIDSKYLPQAEELIKETINQQPTNPQLYYKKALILLKAKKTKESEKALQKALELKPDYQKARELLESSQQSPN